MMTLQERIEEMSKGILMWYPFEDNKKKAVVDSDTMASFVTSDELYDYIILTTVWETEENPKELFQIVRKKLAAKGKLFVMMNNRLGLRYFCGDTDPYTETVVDCLEDYRNYPRDVFAGRMYDKAQMCELLSESGFINRQFFTVLTGIENPSLIFAEDYIPNEDITNRIIATYNHSDTVFAEEKVMYKQLIANDLLNKLANAYLVECTVDGQLCDVSHVTSSLERGVEDALLTIIHRSGEVEKKAAYPEGAKRLKSIKENLDALSARGISVVNGMLEDDSFRMPYIEAETMQLYLEHTLRQDVDDFLNAMDQFRDIIMQSSEIEKEDASDGEGAILKYGYMDMVPLNSFYHNGEIVFFDQEFCIEHLPANVLIWRLVASFYAADLGAEKIYPMKELLIRYGLTSQLSKWQNAEWDFLKALRKENELASYHSKVWANKANMSANKNRMNRSAKYYSRFENIFAGTEGKKLILFGTGKFARRFLAMYGADFPIYAMLDNNAEIVGSKVEGIQVKEPSVLLNLPKGSYKVMICVKSCDEIMNQLDEMGIDDYSVFNPNRYYETRPRTSIRVIKDQPDKNEKTYHVGYVAGAFDMFHIGHLNLLRRAKERCDYLIVGVMSDEKMFALKGKQPVIPCNERMQVVAGCRYADQVEELPLDRAGIRDAYHMFHFDCMFSGDDHSTNQGWLNDQAYLREQGSDIVFVPYTKEQSSTDIRNKMKE